MYFLNEFDLWELIWKDVDDKLLNENSSFRIFSGAYIYTYNAFAFLMLMEKQRIRKAKEIFKNKNKVFPIA